MADIRELCAAFAGGFSQEGSDCVVCIYATGTPSPQLFKVVARAPTADEDPETLLAGVSAWCNKSTEDVLVNVFQLCGGVDGQKLAESKR